MVSIDDIGIEPATFLGIFSDIWNFIIAHPIAFALVLMAVIFISTVLSMIWMNQKVTAWSILKYSLVFGFIVIGVVFFYANQSGTLDLNGFIRGFII